MSNPTREPPTAAEFLSQFLEAFSECLPETDERRSEARTNLTGFMTGKQSMWKPAGKCVLPLTAEKLGLRHGHEYLHLDLVLDLEGDSWGNLVTVEHENKIDGFGEEVQKLMSVLAPLKVGITYGNEKKTTALEALIQKYFRTRHHSIREAPETEYLFLVGITKGLNTFAWKHLSFNCASGPQEKQFQDTGKEFDFGV